MTATLNIFYYDWFIDETLKPLSIMVHQFIRKQKKILTGFINTYWRKKGKFYEDSWWDKSFYTSGISDKTTIWVKQSLTSTRYHYCSVEMEILKHLANNRHKDLTGLTVLDIGSGAGHWIDFYEYLGAKEIVGLDVSQSVVDHLKEKYTGKSGVSIHHGKASTVIPTLGQSFNIVNAIGVMFHLVDDNDWTDTISKIGAVIPEKGMFIIGGHFGLLPNVNAQIDKDGNINKRLRSKSQWKRALRKAGFDSVKFYKNNAYLYINAALPENNVLVAIKGG